MIDREGVAIQKVEIRAGVGGIGRKGDAFIVGGHDLTQYTTRLTLDFSACKMPVVRADLIALDGLDVVLEEARIELRVVDLEELEEPEDSSP